MVILQNIVLIVLLWVSNALGGHYDFPQQRYKTEKFVAPDMKITRSGEPTEPGYLFFDPTLRNTSPLIMTDTNELVWHGPAHAIAQNFRKQTLHNESVISYWGGHRYDHPLNTFGHGTGFVIIMDNQYQQKYNICLSDDTLTWVTPFPTTFPGKTPNPCYIDYHESFITNRGTIIVSAFNVTRADLRPLGGPENGWLFDALFFEIDLATQNVLFRWSAFEHIDITTSNYVNQDGGSQPLVFSGGEHGNTQGTAWDFFHINSVEPVPGGYIVNSRMTWSFYKVDGKTGKVIWTLEGSQGGDFTLEPGIFFSWAHHPRMQSIAENSFQISLFNNDNIRGLVQGVNHSTGYLFNVNTETMHVTALQNFIDPAQPLFSLAEGSHQVLGNSGHSLLGYGAEPLIKEFDASGKTIYTAQFDVETGLGPAKSHSYRAYRYPWKGFPTQKPLVAASFPSGETAGNATRVNVYMSWNGATEYDGWNIYAGSTQGSLQLISGASKDGFETHYPLKAGMEAWNFVMAEAMQGTNGLANSTIVRIRSS